MESFWNENFREYRDLYLKTEVHLLADVFENFRGVCMENYELDAYWYYTAPGLARDACLKKTGAQIELLSDIDMLLVIETGIRDGVSMISTRYSKANNKYMKNFDPTQESNLFSIWMPTTCMVGRCHNHFLSTTLSG